MKKLFSWLSGAKKDATMDASQPEAAPKLNFSTNASSSGNNEYVAYFQDWLRSHGEENIVVKGDKVTLAGNTTSFSARTYEIEEKPNGVVLEVEFLTTLPDGRVIQDFVTGTGQSLKAAQADVFFNYALTTMHVLYAAFFNTQDEHVTPEIATIHGVSRSIYVGDIMVRGDLPENTPHASFDQIRNHLVAKVKETLPNDNKVHWFKIMYGQQNHTTMAFEMDIDPDGNPDFRDAVKDTPWQKAEQFYFLKMVILVK
jgi:Family of unknown function (DUF6348)